MRAEEAKKRRRKQLTSMFAVGNKFHKNFYVGKKWVPFQGTVQFLYQSRTMAWCTYTDGDCEDLSKSEFEALVDTRYNQRRARAFAKRAESKIKMDGVAEVQAHCASIAVNS
jgi:hypothetical protein